MRKNEFTLNVSLWALVAILLALYLGLFCSVLESGGNELERLTIVDELTNETLFELKGYGVAYHYNANNSLVVSCRTSSKSKKEWNFGKRRNIIVCKEKITDKHEYCPYECSFYMSPDFVPESKLP